MFQLGEPPADVLALLLVFVHWNKGILFSMPPPHVPDPTSTLGLKYSVAIAFMAMLGIVAFMTIVSARPDYDRILVLGGLIGAMIPSTFSLLSFLKGEDSRSQARQTYYQVNDRFDEFKELLRKETAILVRDSYTSGLKDGALGATGLPVAAQLAIASPATKPEENKPG